MKCYIEQPQTGNSCSPSGQTNFCMCNNRLVLENLIFLKTFCSKALSYRLIFMPTEFDIYFMVILQESINGLCSVLSRFVSSKCATYDKITPNTSPSVSLEPRNRNASFYHTSYACRCEKTFFAKAFSSVLKLQQFCNWYNFKFIFLRLR